MFTIPIINVKTDPLDALLAAIGYRLSMLVNSDNEDFAALIEDRKVSIQLGSEANGIARYYVFDNGTFKQYEGAANKPSLSINFADSATGVKLLTTGSVPDFMTAIQDKKVTMEGDYSLLMWFSQLAKHITPTIPSELKPYVDQAKPYIYKAGELAQQAFCTVKKGLGK